MNKSSVSLTVCVIKINVVDILSDSMYSDSDDVVDALAELVEYTVTLHDSKVMSEGRMSQVRNLLQVDEATFRARFSPEQLKTIESKEMGLIVSELVSAIGLQRFRFTERQNNGTAVFRFFLCCIVNEEDTNTVVHSLLTGEHGVCRNLARIAASVCTTLSEVPDEEGSSQIDGGALTLLLKAASHPSSNVCAIALPVLTRTVSAMPTMTPELLPLLQRRAITPHRFRDGIIAFSIPDVYGVSYTEFQTFRENVLRDALIACWKANSTHYLESCTSAVEEFCSERSSVEVSLQLEAALFCIEIVSSEPPQGGDSFPITPQMSRLVSALSVKPASLMLNPLTRARACRMLRMVSAPEDRMSFRFGNISPILFLVCKLVHRGDKGWHSVRNLLGQFS